MADKTKKELMREITDLEEVNDDLKVQLNLVTDELQRKTAKLDPAGGLGSGALLRAYCLYLATLDPGLTVGADYDFELNLGAAKHFWIEEGGEAEDLD